MLIAFAFAKLTHLFPFFGVGGGLAPWLHNTEAELLEEEAEMNQGGGEAGKMGGLRRRRRTYSRTLAEHSKPNKQYGHDAEQHREVNMGTDAF